jgi:hypothetical protein
MHSNLSRSHQQIYTDPLPPRRRAPHTIRSLTTIWSAVNTQLLSHNSQWGSEVKTSLCWQPATRLTGPISPTCDRYVQYLLTGVNSSILNWHRRGIQHWRRRLSTYHSPTFPTDDLPFHLRARSGIQFIQNLSTKSEFEFKGTYGCHVVFWPLGHLP